jgi:glycosyltransferase involved in cell wall biosynthesis
MRVLIEGLPTKAGTSLAVIIERLLEAWAALGSDDELHLLQTPAAGIAVPDAVTLHEVPVGRRHALTRIRGQNLLVPRMCRRLNADVMLGVMPATSLVPLPCPRAVIAYDFRHELLPEQFSRSVRAQRKLSYGLALRQVDGVACISERTRRDLLAPRPWLANREIRVAYLGSDHVASWHAEAVDEPYAVAFGQFGNKNAAMVIDAWAILRDRGEAMRLKLIGMPDEARDAAEAQLRRLGLEDLVEIEGWLFGEDLRRRFASAALLAFPSNFEGFGLPPIEAMRLGIPVVITPEPAMLEVTGGHATVMGGWTASALADGVIEARNKTAEELDAARRRAEEFSWRGMALEVRSMLEAISA